MFLQLKRQMEPLLRRKWSMRLAFGHLSLEKCSILISQSSQESGHIMVGARQKPVMMRNVMEFGYLMNKFGRERIVDERTEKHGVALVFEPTESQNFLLGKQPPIRRV